MKPSPTEIQRRRHRDLELCRDQRATIVAQRDALLAAAEAVLAHMVASRTDKTSAGGVRSFRYEGTEYEVVTKLRAAVQAAKGGAE